MDMTLTTPALLFPAISLLRVAYTNCFNTIGARVRTLHSQYRENPNDIIVGQIHHLRRRLTLIRNMQAFVTPSSASGLIVYPA